MSKKSITVVGLGSIGMRHAKNLLAMGHEVYGYDTDDKRYIDLVKAGGKIAGDPIGNGIGTEAAVIACPTDQHYAYYLEAQKNFVFMEKPIAHVYLQGLETVTMVGYNLRFHPCVMKAKEWIDDSELGYPIWANFVCSQYSEKPEYLYDGVILNWSHEIDLALYLLGDAKVMATSTRLGQTGHDDMTDFVLLHSNGCRSAIHLDYLTRPEIRQTIIVGSEATIIIDLFFRQAWLRFADGSITEHYSSDDSFDDDYREEMHAFINRLNGLTNQGCTGKEGLAALKICLDIRKEAGLA